MRAKKSRKLRLSKETLISRVVGGAAGCGNTANTDSNVCSPPQQSQSCGGCVEVSGGATGCGNQSQNCNNGK
jgi:hypothetical protein